MKFILTFLFSFVFLVSGFSQTRNVVVGTNDVIVQPTNFWSANASNGRTGLGLGSAATNPASAFQPSSAVLSNLASSNAVNLTNLRATNIIGVIPSSNIPTVSLTNISGTLSILSGGTGATNADGARTNLGLGATWLTNTNVTNFRTAIGLGVDNAPTFAAIRLGTTNINFESTIEDEGIHWFLNRGTNLPQSIVTLGYFTNSILSFLPIEFQTNIHAAQTRTNLGLGWSALTNSNAGTGLVSVNTNGEVVSPTNFWDVAPIQTLVQNFLPSVNATNAATNARTLYVYSMALSTTGVTHVITLPTNTSTKNGDEVTVIHMAPTSSVTAIRQLGQTNNLITINRTDEAVKFIYENNAWTNFHNISFVEPIQFSGTNASVNAAVSRTNLGLGTTNSVVFYTVGVSSIFVDATTNKSIDVNDKFLANASGINGVALDWGESNVILGLPISFSTNINAATTRTNLGLGFSALTNTSVTNFQKAIFYTNTAPSNIGGNLGTIAAWIEIVASNGVTYKVPAYTNVP